MAAVRPAPDRPVTVSIRDPASFRDPSGFVYRRAGILYRQIEPGFAADWEAFVESGLAQRLIADGQLVDHDEADLGLAATPGAYRVIRPRPVGFVSYPYEWSFSQLKDAAVLTLDVQAAALEAGFTLKDASAYNVQFDRGRPILIDSLSFERAVPGQPWVAYRQFCEHFVAPLALMAYVDIRLHRLQREYLDGVPLDLAARLLPRRTWLRFGLAAHVHVHARAQRQYADRAETVRVVSMSLTRQQALLASLRATVSKLDWAPAGTEWADYADHTSYGEGATASKGQIVADRLAAAGGRIVWDLGANTGVYSRLAAAGGSDVLALDIDPAAVERNYRALRRDGTTNILPLVMDVADPSPGLGWSNRERAPLLERGRPDVVLALALVHHLAIGRNLPLPAIGELLARIAPDVILEFVPKEDPMVRRLLANRRDVFPDYSLDGLRAAFEPLFSIAAEIPVEDSPRTILHLRRRAA
jgi:ribosomal protein L11 methylase PrmA